MDLDDHAGVAPRDDERHVRGARSALVGGDDDAKTTVGRKRKRAVLLDAKLGSENMHRQALERLEGGRLSQG
jgi:hypothetical protein